MSPSLTLLAPAKINLYLRVLGRRSDGFHALDSMFHAVGLYDRLTLAPAPTGISFSCSDPALAGPGNLVVRAASLLAGHLAERVGARIHLHKEIPVGAGLGGGSSDAAAALIGLNRLWNAGIAPEQLAGMGAGLGSDVPFFLRGGACRVGGRGEVVVPQAAREGWCVLLFPGVHVDTATVFRHFSAHSGPPLLTDDAPLSIITNTLGEDSGLCPCPEVNDLQTAACEVAPVISDALEALESAGAERPRMSGSGSAVFALERSRESAEALGRRVKVAPGWRMWVVPLVGAGVSIGVAGSTDWGVDKR